MDRQPGRDLPMTEADVTSKPSESDLVRSEIKDKVDDLEALLLALEQTVRDGKPPIEALHLILRHAHSLKGTLGMAERTAASTMVHAMETVFVKLRDGRLDLGREIFDLAFASLDHLNRLVADDREDAAALAEIGSRWTALDSAAEGHAARAVSEIPFPLDADEAARLRRAVASGHRLYLVAKSIYGNMSREDYDGLSIYGDIANLGELVARHPHFEALDRNKHEALLILLGATKLDLNAVKDQIFDPVHALTLSERDSKAYLEEPAPAPASTIRSLIVEDDFTSRLMLQRFLAPLGESHVAVDGEEAVSAFEEALRLQQPYQLICLDIMMPKLDGQAVLRAIRAAEEHHGLPLGKGTKVVMTTSLKDNQNIMTAFREQCDAYLVKPIARSRLLDQLRALGLSTGS